MTQLMGMIRYEIAMAWRRGASPITLVLMLVLPPAVFFATSPSGISGLSCMCDVKTGEYLPAEAVDLLATSIMLAASIYFVPVLMIAVPLMFADTIPLDRHYGVSELLTSLPVSPRTYVAGKVGAVAGTILGLLAISAGLAALLLLGIRGYRPEAEPLLLMWFGGIVILGVVAVMLGVLLPAFARTRRQAVAWGLGAVMAAIYISTRLPIYKLVMISFNKVSVVTYPIPIVLPDELVTYPSPFSQPYLLNYGILALALGALISLVLVRMRRRGIAI